MNWLFSWIVAFLVTWPVSFQLSEFSGKPIDLVGSDLLFALIVLVPRRQTLVIPRSIVLGRLTIVRLAAASTLIYCGALAATAYAESSELSRVVSAIKFVKPLAFVLLGSFLAAVTSPLVLVNRIIVAFSCISCLTFATAVCMPGFPSVAWGAYLFGYPLYGFPNSAMTFFAITVPLQLAAADSRPTILGKRLLRMMAGLTGGIVVTSLSRSSTLAMMAGVLIYLYFTGRVYLPLFVGLCGVMMVMMFSSALDIIAEHPDIQVWVERFTARISRTMDSSDPFSGRTDIWEQTIQLWSERPLWGYAFEPFSNYSEYDTTHQQYLEILFKAGAAGAVLYGLLLLTSGVGLLHMMKHAVPHSRPWYLLRGLFAAFTATLLGNLSQPNLTYSVTGNALFFLLGLALNKHAAAGLLVRTRVAESSHRKGTPTGTSRNRNAVGHVPQRPSTRLPKTPHTPALVSHEYARRQG